MRRRRCSAVGWVLLGPCLGLCLGLSAARADDTERPDSADGEALADPAQQAPRETEESPGAPEAFVAPEPLGPRRPLEVEYVQYGVALAAESNLSAGAACPDDADAPCILGGGAGLVVRGGYRPFGPWYVGGAYEFVRMNAGQIYRLGIFQQVRAEMRYLPETGYRTAPYLSWGLGAVGYGNEWGLETGGGLAFIGGGFEYEVTRFAVFGMSLAYQPVLLAGWTDTAGQVRDTALAQFLRLEVVFELRSEIGRRDTSGLSSSR